MPPRHDYPQDTHAANETPVPVSGEPENNRYPDEDEDVEESRSNRRTLKAMGGIVALGVLGGYLAYNTVAGANERDSRAIHQIYEGNRVSTPTEEIVETEPTEAPTTTAAKPTQSAKPTTTAPKPTETPKASAVVVPAVAACVETTPVELKAAQQTMLPFGSDSDFAEVMALQKKYPTNWTITNNVDNAKLKQVQNVYPGIRARYATNNEGGAATWFKNPGADALPSLADIEGGKVSGDELQQLITANLTKLKSEGIFQNFAPVVDVATQPGQEKGRMFSDIKEVEAYLRTYNEIANKLGVYVTIKHFPDGMANGNTNTQAEVKTASYAELEKSGRFKPYTTLDTKGNKNWAMMSSTITSGWPDAKLDNKKQNVFNPAAYAALDKLTGGAPVVTDAFGPNVGAHKDTPVSEAVASAWAAGANMVLISAPDTGKTLTQQFEAILQAVKAAEKSGDLKPEVFDTSYLKVLGNKGLSACNVLKAYDAKAYDELTKPKPTATATTTPAPAPTAGTSVPATGTPAPSASTTVSRQPETAAATTTK